MWVARCNRLRMDLIVEVFLESACLCATAPAGCDNRGLGLAASSAMTSDVKLSALESGALRKPAGVDAVG